MTTVSFPIVAFLFLAGVNHVVEIVRKKNYAPNNTLILIWDFGIPISVVGLLIWVFWPAKKEVARGPGLRRLLPGRSGDVAGLR